MAKVIGPLGSSEARGKVGGLIYNTWRGISTVKVKHAPSQPRTSLQLALRAIAISIVRLWASCAYQLDWNEYARTHPYTDGMGNSIRATGANWFVALGTRLLRNSIPIVATPPVVAAPASLTTLTAIDAGDHIEVDWTPLLSATENVEIWIDGPHSQGKKGSLPSANWNGNGTGTVGAFNTGPLPVGRYSIFGRVISITDGQVSLFLSVDVDRA